jgi:hypothetical protein
LFPIEFGAGLSVWRLAKVRTFGFKGKGIRQGKGSIRNY